MEILLILTFLSLSFAYTTPHANTLQARTLAKYMNSSVNPCEDFYEYACGNWRWVHSDKNYYSALGLIDYQADLKIATILENEDSFDELSFVILAREYYAACIDVEAYLPQKYLNWIQQQEQLVWPTLLPLRSRHNSAELPTYDWLHVLGKLRRYGFNGVFLEETVIQRSDKKREYIIDIDKPVLNGGFKKLTKREYVLVFKYVRQNSGTDTAKVQDFWSTFHRFESRLQRLSETNDDNEMQLVRFEELQRSWLVRYLRIVVGNEVKFNNSTLIRMNNLNYLTALLSLLIEHESEFICRYLMIRFLWHLYLRSPNKFDRQECATSTRDSLPYAVFWLYEQHYKRLAADEIEIRRIFNALRRQFNQTLASNVNRFDAKVQLFLQAKLDRMQLKVGNLPRPHTEMILGKFYADLSISDNFYSNHLASMQHIWRTTHELVGHKPVEDVDSFFQIDEGDTTGISSSPYYLQQMNIVIIPLTFLQQPMYHPQLQKVYKYSALGFLLAHEIMHGFDFTGIDYDMRGIAQGPGKRIRKNNAFSAHLNCLRERNPNVLDEKIADVSGLRLAYEAYFRGYGCAKKEKQRLFFQNFAQFFCYTSNEDIDDSEHGGFRERVLDALDEFEEFSRVYECSSGYGQQRANQRRETCQLWR